MCVVDDMTDNVLLPSVKAGPMLMSDGIRPSREIRGNNVISSASVPKKSTKNGTEFFLALFS
jgi:hypothetical protein